MNNPPRCYSEGYRAGEKAAAEKYHALLTRIAEVDGPIECASLQEWREKVKKMAANGLKGKT
jgi:hypothetical protein